MKKTILTVILTVVIALILIGVGWTIFVFTGSYNVSTSNHDNGFVNWWLARGAVRSVKNHARGIKAPPLDDPAMVEEGFQHYDEMCVQCHGAPGKDTDEIAKGLWPKAPDLSKAVPHWSPAELFWITKNGIKFSAMPGWGATHDDKKIWSMVAFMEKLPKLSANDYQQMATNTVKTGSGEDEHHQDEHHH